MNITGRLIDDAGNPLKDLTVQAWHYNVLFGPRHIGDAVTTGDDGKFSISITITSEFTSGVVKINLHLRVFSKVGRLLLISENRDLAFIGVDWPIGDLKIHRNTVSGWRVTNRDPQGNRAFYSEANNLLPMIDNELAWSAVNQAVLASTQEVNFLCFYFAIPNVRVAFGPNEPKEGVPTVGARLEESLLKINQDGILATVRILSRKAVLGEGAKAEIGLFMSSASRVKDFFSSASSQPNTVFTRSYECSFRLPMHAKMITFDGVEAHIMGSPLDQQYFDSQKHEFDNPRRGQGGGIRVPIHEVSLRIQGEAIPHIHDVFNIHWVASGESPIPARPKVTPPPPHHPVQMVRTLRGDRFSKPFGEIGILEAYQRVFERAEDFIYFETQYFVNLRIMAAIRAALRDPKRPNLQIIGCINIHLDLPRYDSYQRDRVPAREKDLVTQLFGALDHDGTLNRFDVFCLWTHEPRTPKQLLIRNYIHAKVAFADDKWLTIGSANLDGVSLDSSDSYVTAPRWPDSEFGRCATEVNALIFNGVDSPPTPSSTVPADVRQAIWAEHLGADADVINRPQGGWLSLWRDKATDKLLGLNANPPQVLKSKILKWNNETQAVKYLKAAGVTDPLRFDVREKVRDFDFKTGKWSG
jgi:phosphatidylserine/phosphatidylglycerophosphate/cardiolipin synthase-like enzyme